MKLSEFLAPESAPETFEDRLPYPCSELAEPAITLDEARAADTAICRWHNGRIKTEPTQSDVEGGVYFCPIGRQYWRYSKQGGGFLKLPPLQYPKARIA
jgi:hypothetical protein